MKKPDITNPNPNMMISPEVAIMAMAQQVRGVMHELNLMSIRVAVMQNLLKSKAGVTEEDIKTEWGNVIEEAKKEAARERLVTPDGRSITMPGPEEGAQTPPQEGHA